MQETLEDIDRNGDGHVDEDEYIGELIQKLKVIGKKKIKPISTQIST